MVQDICLIIIAASLAIIVVYHIPVLVQFRRTAREVEKTMETARTHIVPLSHDLTVLSQEIKGILESVRRQIDKVEEGVDAFRGTAVRLRDFEEEILQKIEKPVLELSALASALIRGTGVFLRLFRLVK
ncbi:MAG: DUF948 domain-containing protein [Deltaproteobacteria bacterium]|nr:DUF948 domain-containing protein [Deltaproteobacteria bacterium]